MTGTDMRHAFRLFAKYPAFVFTVTLIMALSIGFCTAIFSLVKVVLLTGLPYENAERLAIIWHTDANSEEVTGVWARDYRTYRDTTRSFESVAAFATEGYNLSNGSEPSRITCARVTSNLFPLLGVAPFRGRWFTNEEDRDGADRTVVLSYDLWRTRFGSDDDVLGQTIRLDLQPHTVVGIMPPSFTFPPEGARNVSRAGCWAPASFSPAELAMPAFNWIVLGSLKPGVGIAQAQQDASAVAQRILESYPAAVQKEVALRARVVPLEEEVGGRSRRPFLVFAGSVGFLLLIGCANVANLMLTKLHVRQREIAIRAALGAKRSSLTAQLLMESITLAGCGGLLGIPIAFGMLRLLVILNPGGIPMPDRIDVDMPVLAFTIACSVLSGMLSGIVPALRARTVDVAATVAEGNRGASAGLRHTRLRSVLAVSEIALALVLLIGAGLLLRSYLNLASVPPGFDPKNVVTFSVALPHESYSEAAHARRFVDALLERMSAFTGVELVSAGTSLPIGPSEATVFSRIGAPPAVAGFKPAFIQTITPEYLRAFRIASRRGRVFEAGDDASSAPVALVNETMAERYWRDTEVIGQQLYWLAGGRSLTVVGVVSDVRQDGLSAATLPAFYVPLAQSPQSVRNLSFAVRTEGTPRSIASQVRRAVTEVDPSLPVFSLQSGDDMIRNSIANERFNMFVVSVFAACALALSILGLYSVLSYVVIHSSRELGIRMAMGATPQGILRMVLARGLKFLFSGMLIGTALALMMTRFIQGMLFGISGTDGITFLGVVVLLTGIALVAIAIPAIRAAKLDPVTTLR